MQASVDEIHNFLLHPGKLAIVGASTKEGKAGFYVPKYLRSLGFETILINPKTDKIQDIKTLKSLDEVSEFKLKGVIIYRKLPDAENVAIKAIEMGIPFIWLPDKIISEKAQKLAKERNLMYVQDDCPLRRGRQLLKQ